MRPEEAAALSDIAAVFAVPVLYTGAGLAAAPIDAIRSDVAADAFQGAGSTLRETSYEIQSGNLPQKPRKGNIILDGDERWSVNDVTWRADLGAWVLVVEEAPAP